MKKLFLMIAMATFVITSFAQSANDGKKTEFEMFAGASLNDFVGKDADATKMKVGFHAGFTGRYNIKSGLFLDGSLAFATKGRKTDESSSSGKTWDDYGPNYDSELKTTMVTYNLEVPISIGYRLSLTDDMKVRIKVGPYVTYALFGEKKQKGYYTYFPDTHSSETDRIDETTKLSDINDYKRFGIGLQGGIGFEFDNQVTLSASYQRGLTSLDEQKDVFEQNILISLGYRF